MKGLAQAVKGMRLVNTDAIIQQGRRAYHLGIELRDNPQNSDLGRKLWTVGWNNARDRWTGLLKRNGGFLSLPHSLANPAYS